MLGKVKYWTVTVDYTLMLAIITTCDWLNDVTTCRHSDNTAFVFLL